MIPNLKKYGKYALIAGGGVVLILGYIFITSWMKKRRIGDEGMSEGTEELKDVINEIGNKMTEAEIQADVEIAVARGEEKAAKEELKEVVKIKDRADRRRRLAEMYKRTQ